MKTMRVEIGFPDWVRFMATDHDGRVYGYSHAPKKYYSTPLWNVSAGIEIFLYWATKPEDWTQELYEVSK